MESLFPIGTEKAFPGTYVPEKACKKGLSRFCRVYSRASEAPFSFVQVSIVRSRFCLHFTLYCSV